MTLAQRLADDAHSLSDAMRAERFLIEHLPTDQPIILTDAAVRAALAGDPVALALSIAPEEALEPDELLALQEFDADPDRDQFVNAEEIRRKYLV